MMVDSYLLGWDRRRRAASSIMWGMRGLALGFLVALLSALAARVWPLLSTSGLLTLAILSGLTGLAAGILAAWLWPRPVLEMARFWDRQLGLKERLSTAVEVELGRLAPPEWLVEQQLSDALQAARSVDASQAVPLRVHTADWLPVALTLAALLAAIWLPNPQQEILDQRAAVREAVQDQVEVLDALRDEIAADPGLTQEDRQALMEVLDSTIESLERRDLTPEEAMAALTEGQDRLRELAPEGSQSQVDALKAVAVRLGDSATTEHLAELLEQSDLEAAGAALQGLAEQVGELTPEEQLELAEALADAAAELAGTNPKLAQDFAQAAEAIQQGNMDAASEALAEAAETVARTGEEAATVGAAQAAADQMASSGQAIAQASGGNTSTAGGSESDSGDTEQGGAGGGAGSGESDASGSGGEASSMDGGGPADGGMRDYEPIYVPQRLGGDGGPEVELPSGDNLGELVRELPSDPEMGSSTVPYNQVYADYLDAANQALEDEQIPLSLRGYIRDYFSSLQPTER